MLSKEERRLLVENAELKKRLEVTLQLVKDLQDFISEDLARK